jgi:predicted secreted hydrolase
MVCYEYDDKKIKTCLASILYKDGKNEHYKNVEIIPSGKKWQSSKTKAIYPISWKINIPQKNINLIIEPLLKKQEVIFGTINYWEGPITIKGKFNSKIVSGNGFMELVGYPSKYTNFEFMEDKILETAKYFISNTKKYIK